jgi:hypothetical protein
MFPHPSEFLGGQFPIGVDDIDIAGQKRWRDMGANFLTRGDLINLGQGRTRNTWEEFGAGAEAAGLKTIRAAAGVDRDAKDPTLIAIALPDEPDLSNHWYLERPAAGFPADFGGYEWTAPGGRVFKMVGKEGGNPYRKTGATLATTAEVFTMACQLTRAAYPNKPLFVNFAGNAVTSAQSAADFAAYELMSRGTDWQASDWYPLEHNLTPFPLPAGVERRYPYSLPGRAASRLLNLSKGQPQLAYIAPVLQRLGKPAERAAVWRWPTPEEVSAQVWAAICMGATGIIYYVHQQENGFVNDAIFGTVNLKTPGATAADVAAAKKIAEFLPVLNQQIQAVSQFLLHGVRVAEEAADTVAAKWQLGGRVLGVLVNTAAKPVSVLGPCEVVITPPAPVPTPVPGPTPTPSPSASVEQRIGALEAQMATLNDFRARILDATHPGQPNA